MFRQAIRKASTVSSQGLKKAFPPGDAQAAKAFKDNMISTIQHSEKMSKMWFKISLFVGLPSVLLAAIHTYFVEAEHAKHRQHLKDIPDEEWPADYPYQNLRHKPFFWGDGDKTLFWNPVVNRHISRD